MFWTVKTAFTSRNQLLSKLQTMFYLFPKEPPAPAHVNVSVRLTQTGSLTWVGWLPL